MDPTTSYPCPKCNHQSHTLGQMRATGGFLSKLFDVQSQRFTSVTCDRCTYTEFYKTKQSMIGNVFDLFAGG